MGTTTASLGSALTSLRRAGLGLALAGIALLAAGTVHAAPAHAPAPHLQLATQVAAAQH